MNPNWMVMTTIMIARPYRYLSKQKIIQKDKRKLVQTTQVHLDQWPFFSPRMDLNIPN